MKSFILAVLLTCTVPAFAQSENLDPKKEKKMECFYRQQVQAKLIHKHDLGMSKEAFWLQNPLPQGWSEDMKKVAISNVDKIWSLNSTDVRKWIMDEYQNCLKLVDTTNPS